MKKFTAAFLFVWASLFLSACGYLIQPNVKQGVTNFKPGHYVLDPHHTTVLFKVNHMGLSTFVGRFNHIEASLDFDPKNPSAAKLSAVVYTESIDVNNADFTDTLKGKTWFDSATYPHATFITTQVEQIDGGTMRFNGELTLLGVSQPVVLAIHFNGAADNLLTGRYTLGFSASSIIKRSDFGMKQYIPAIGDDVELEIHAEFQRR